MRYAFFDDTGRISSAHNDAMITDLPAGAVLLSEEQWEHRFDLKLVDGELVDDPATLSDEQRWANYQKDARALLEATDLVALRCLKAGVAYPDKWQTYTADLRAIVRSATGDPDQPLPTTPTKPEGI